MFFAFIEQGYIDAGCQCLSKVQKLHHCVNYVFSPS
jgi:hypothetical protein